MCKADLHSHNNKKLSLSLQVHGGNVSVFLKESREC